AEHGIFHPIAPRGYGIDTTHDSAQVGAFSNDAAGSGLKETQGFGLRHGHAPDDDLRRMIEDAQLVQPLEHGMRAERLINNEEVRRAGTDERDTGFERLGPIDKLEPGTGFEKHANALGGDRLGIAYG